jgi:hypothetical protein
MSERQQHRNPWAEKLSQVSLPDGGESWKTMEALLDRRMPTRSRWDKRRWFLLILLLLLLIGVCNCPGRRWLFSGESKTGGTFQPVPVEGKGQRGPLPAASPRKAEPGVSPGQPAPNADSGHEEADNGRPPAGTTQKGPDTATLTERPEIPVKRAETVVGKPKTLVQRAETVVGRPKTLVKTPETVVQRVETVVEGPKTPVKRPRTAAQTKPPHTSEVTGVTDTTAMTKGGANKGDAHNGGANKGDANKGDVNNGGANKGGANKGDANKGDTNKDSVNKGDVTMGGVNKGAATREDAKKGDAKKGDPNKAGEKKGGGAGKKDAGKKEDSSKTERQDGWMVGIGLNQFFTVGGQQASSYNSGGITGTLGDYIPVPMLRYYINPKLYVQLEAQINTPQYTKKNLVAVSTPRDSLSAVQTVQRTVAINKLFYFNVPVSVHYTVFDHLDLGAGLQYSRLTNGIGVFNNDYNNNGTDSLATETKSIKGDSAYKEIKTHEFRFLVDANYNWKHFIVGIRYNQALSKFIHVEISPGQITQSRNSSLQLYLRYILWDGRKKKPVLPAK